ncbi:hypothetical protein EDD17DRAFT_1750374 [Pisolithus thermaeus]|nr:hypothetical protein EDD17DRAFT_1750374 [Pisolithus thermaeus]
MVSTAVVPHFCKLLDSRGFDPYSVRDVKRIIDVPEQVEVSICSHKILMILKSMHSVFENATAAAETLLSPFLRFDHGIQARQHDATLAEVHRRQARRWCVLRATYQ